MIQSDSFARCCAIFLAMTGSTAMAEGYDLDASRFGMQIALIIGAADKCAYQIDEDAVSALVAKEVPADNLDFAGMFQMQISYNRQETGSLEGIDLRLRCETARRSAESLGLLKE